MATNRSGSTRSTSAPRSRQAQYRAGVIETYSRFIETRIDPETGDKFRFNTVLGEPKDKDRNCLGLPHGDIRAYDMAKCQCPECRGAQARKQAAADEARLARVKEGDAERVAAAMLRIRPALSPSVAASAGAAVVATSGARTRTSGRQIKLAYTEALVTMALKLWNLEHNAAAPLDDAELVSVARGIVAALAE